MNATPPPAVVKWYKIYAGFMAALYILCFLLSLFGFFLDPADPEFKELPLWIFRGFVVFISLLCAALAGLYIYSFFLSNTPRAWVYHLILICIGLTSACCMLASIPLLIFWIRPDTQAYFGRGSRSS